MFDDVSRPQRAPGRWLSYYLLGRKVGVWGLRTRHIFVDDCWCHPRIEAVGTQAQLVIHEKGGH